MKKRLNISVVGLVIFSFAVLYWSTMARTVTGFADSDELSGVSYLGGALHPPGYPWLRLVVYLMTHLLLWLPVSMAANVTSVMFQALTVGLAYLNAELLLRILYPKMKPNARMVSSLVAALGLGLSFYFWLMANVLEVFPMSNLLGQVMIWLGLSMHIGKRNEMKMLVFWVVVGIALSHHQLIIVLFPGLLMMVAGFLETKMVDRKSVLMGPVVVGLVVWASYVTLAVSASDAANWSWQIKPGISGWVSYLTRDDFSGALIEAGKDKPAYFSHINWRASLASIKHYLTQALPNHWGLLLVGFSGLGIIQLGRSKMKSLKWSVLLMLVLSTIGVAGYLNVPVLGEQRVLYYQELELVERMYVLGYTLMVLPIAVGVAGLLNNLVRLFDEKEVMVGSFLGVLLFVSSMYLKNYRGVDLSEYDAVDKWTESLLGNSPEDSVIICFTDITCFPLLYKWHIEGRYSDKALVAVTPQIKTSSQLIFEDINLFSYADNPFRIGDIVSWNIMRSGREVILSDINPFYFDFLGMDAKVFAVNPEIGGWRVACDARRELVMDRDWERELASNYTDERATSVMHFKEFLADYHATAATLYGRRNDKVRAYEHILAGLQLSPQNAVLHRLRGELAQYDGDDRYLEWRGCGGGLVESSCNDGDAACLLRNGYAGVLLMPDDPLERLKWAEALLKAGYLSLAKREYVNVLSLDEDNQEALKVMDSLKDIEDL